MSRYAGLQTVSSSRVLINVYDLNEMNDSLYGLGLGMYHSGVQIGGLEWTFAGGAGIYSDSPKSAPAAFRESIDMGEFAGSSRDIDAILDDLRQKFRPNSYNVLSQNCNSFAEDFVERLLAKPLPGYINRLAGWGSMIQCLLPPSLTDAPAPVGDTSGAGGAFGGSGGGQYGGGNRQSLNPTAAFQGSGRALGAVAVADGEMRPMNTASSAAASTGSTGSAEALRRARLSAMSK
jgi:hypothetical protein